MKNPRIFVLLLYTDTFAVSPVGLEVSAGVSKVSALGCSAGREDELAGKEGTGGETLGSESGVMAL